MKNYYARCFKNILRREFCLKKKTGKKTMLKRVTNLNKSQYNKNYIEKITVSAVEKWLKDLFPYTFKFCAVDGTYSPLPFSTTQQNHAIFFVYMHYAD